MTIRGERRKGEVLVTVGVRTAGATCSPGGHRGSGLAGPAAVQRAADPEDETMTLRFIVARILRELS